MDSSTVGGTFISACVRKSFCVGTRKILHGHAVGGVSGCISELEENAPIDNILQNYLFPSKKLCMSSLHSSSNIPDVTDVLGWSAWGAYLEYPLFSSFAPYTTLEI